MQIILLIFQFHVQYIWASRDVYSFSISISDMLLFQGENFWNDGP